MMRILGTIKRSVLGKATLWNMMGSGIPLLMGVITIPILINELGTERFALLTLLWTAVGYFSFFDLGFGRALTHAVARDRAENTYVNSTLIRTGLWSVFMVGIVAIFLLMPFMSMVCKSGLKISEAYVEDATKAFQFAVLGIPLVTLSTGLRGVLEGFEDFKSSGILRMELGILNFLLPAVLVFFNYCNLEWIVVSLMLARLLSIVHGFYFLRRNALRLERTFFDFKLLKPLLRFGTWFSLSSVIGPVMVNLDRYLIGGLLSTAILSYYTVPQDFVIRLLFIPIALSGALFPRMTHLFSQSSTEASQLLYKRAIRGLGLVMGLIIMVLGLGAFPAIKIWLGLEFALRAYPLTIVLLIGLFFNSLALIPYTAIQARGGVKTTGLIHVVELILYIPALYWAVMQWGLLGAAVLWSLRTGLDLLLLHVAYMKYYYDSHL